MSQSMSEILRLTQRARRAERIAKARKKAIEALIVGVLVGFAAGWELMLLLGILHHEWSPEVPALGFWLCVAMAALLQGIVRGLGYKSEKSTGDDSWPPRA